MTGRMAEVPLSALDARQQKLVENAHVAWAQGNASYVLMVAAPILKEHPGCLPVRRLVYAARLKLHGAKNVLAVQAIKVRSLVALVLGAKDKSAAGKFEWAERVLAAHPTNTTALKLQAAAAHDLGWLQTTILLREAVQALAPQDQRNRLALGEAWLLVERPDQALRIADAILRERPVDGEAQDLMRKASIAQTVSRGNWAQPGDFRGKLNPGQAPKG